jgi:hypothetical protein
MLDISIKRFMVCRALRESGGREIVKMQVPQGILLSGLMFYVIWFWLKNVAKPNDDLLYN